MSPEQVQGAAIDGRSDVYSLGVILFQMLSGRLPYDANTPIGLAFKHVSEPIPSIQALAGVRLPAAYQTVINTAMAKQAADRYPTAVAMARDLTRLVHGSGPQPTIVVPKDNPLAATQRVADGPPSAGAWNAPSWNAVPATPAPGAASAAAAAPTARVTPPAATPMAAPRAERRGPPVWLWGLLALLLVGGGVAAFLFLRNGGEEPEPTAVVVVAPDWTATPETTAEAPTTAVATAVATPAGAEAAGAATATVPPTPRPLKTAVTPVLPTGPAAVRVLAASDVRTGPGQTFPVAGPAGPGEELAVIGRTEDSAWFNVVMTNGAPGWLPAAAVEPVNAAAMTAVPVAGTIPPSPTSTATTSAAPTATRRPATPTLPPPTATQPPPTQPPPATEPPPPTDEPEPPPTEPPDEPTPVPIEPTPVP